MSGLSNSEALMKRFEESSKEQETNIVIELGTDRMIKWIGVYVLLALAGITKIVSIAGKIISKAIITITLKPQLHHSGSAQHFVRCFL